MSKLGYVLGSIGIIFMIIGVLCLDQYFPFGVMLTLWGGSMFVLVAKYEGYM